MSLATRVLEAMVQSDHIAPPPVMFAMFQCIEQLDDIDDPIVTRKILECFEGFCSYIPSQYYFQRDDFLRIATHLQDLRPGPDNKQPTVPLYEVLTNCGEAILDLVGPLFHKAMVAEGYFPDLRKQLLANENDASGISQVDRILGRKDVIGSDEYDGEPEELIRLYLRHTPFYPILHTQIPFIIPRKTFASHGIILAPPNHGNTQLLGAFIARFLKEEDPIGAFVLDPHGDLFNVLRDRVAPDRCVVLDPDEYPPPLNFLDFGSSNEAQTLQTFTYLMSSLSGGLTDKQGAIVPYLLKLLRRIEGASLETLRQIVDERVKNPAQSEFAEAIASLPLVDQGFFRNQFYAGKMDETKQAIGWKIYSAMASDAFREMFSAKTNSVDFDQLIADRKVVLVKGARRSLGDEGMRVFLQFMVAQYFAAGLRRDRLPPERRHLCILFADEAHTVMDSPIIASILVELRKFACGFFGATQTWHQVADDVKSAVLGATAIRILGPISHNDAVVLARECYTTPDFIRDMKAVERSHADWAFYVSGMTDHAARVRVPYGILDELPRQRRKVLLPPRTSPTGNAIPARPVEQRVEVDKDEEGFREDEREWILADMKAAREASEATIKPGRDWSESDE